jgi:thioredoxin 2
MARPPIFADLDLSSALERSKTEGKLLLVDATAGWCGPCEIMDRITWRDPGVMEALSASALLIQVDVDACAEDAKQLSVRAMPTVIAFRGGVEIDRIVGLQKPEQILGWVAGLRRGETALDLKRAEVAQNPSDMQVRMAMARCLVESNRLEEATDLYVWLWEHMLEHDRSMYGVRLSFFVGALQDLFGRHPPARERFDRLRTASAPPAKGAPPPDALVDWFALNEALGEKEASLAWFDSVRADLLPDDRLARLLQRSVGDLLVAANRWQDVAALYPQPLATLAEAGRLRQETMGLAVNGPSELGEEIRAFADGTLRQTAFRLVRALRAAGRVDEARAVAEEARKLDGSREMDASLLSVEGRLRLRSRAGIAPISR